MEEPYVLSISEGMHEASIALLKGMELKVFAEQERHSRYRHHFSGTVTADIIYKVLETENISPEQVDYVYYCNLTDLNELLGQDSTLSVLKQIIGIKEFEAHWKNVKALSQVHQIHSNHHEQHCAASFYASGFESALGLVIDGFGDLNDSITLFKCSRKEGIVELKKYARKYSLGDFYNQAATLCGLGNNSEGKLMGLAAYWKSDCTYSNFDKETKEMKNGPLIDWYAAQSDLGFREGLKDHIHYIRIAGEVQKIFNNTVLDLTEYLKSFDPEEENLIIAGGCMLNCTANAEIEKQGLFKNIYCFPATNDAGIVLGAAYMHIKELCKEWEPKRIEHVYYGVGYPRSKTPLRLKSVSSALSNYNMQEVVDLLINNKVVAWYQGRSEVGPRALGHRSLLASVENIKNWDFINKYIKEREPFRPLAPIVLDKYYLDIFDDPNPENLSSFMLKNVIIKEEWRKRIPAVCHIDNTARPQYLKREINPELYDLIEAYYEKTGIPMLINTSLNGKGEPIVENFDNLLRFMELHPAVDIAVIDAKRVMKLNKGSLYNE